MSWSRVTPKSYDDAHAASPWQLPAMNAGGKTAERSPEKKADPQAEELERLRQAAYAEAHEQGRRVGYEAGFGEGREAGLTQGQAEVRPMVERMQSLLDSLTAPAAEFDDAVETELTQMVLAVAHQIIRRELQSQPGEIIGIIREAVGLLPLSARDIRVRLHPDDASFVRKILGDNATAWQLMEDPGVTRGGCLVNTPASRIDATLEHRLAALTADMLGGARQSDREAET